MRNKTYKNGMITLKAGDRIVIDKEPQTWNSALNKNCPLVDGLTFPHTLTIKKISFVNEKWVMTCGEYGWSIDSILNAGFLSLKTLIT